MVVGAFGGKFLAGVGEGEAVEAVPGGLAVEAWALVETAFGVFVDAVGDVAVRHSRAFRSQGARRRFKALAE